MARDTSIAEKYSQDCQNIRTQAENTNDIPTLLQLAAKASVLLNRRFNAVCSETVKFIHNKINGLKNT